MYTVRAPTGALGTLDPSTAPLSKGPRVLVAGFPAGPPATNCYVVAPAAGEQCVVIDPGIEAVRRLDELLTEHRLHPVAVLLTHGHFDHTFSVVPVCDARDVPAFVHPADRHQVSDPWSGIGAPPGTPLFGRLTFAEPSDLRELADGQTLSLAGLDLSVRLTPGHTPGSVVFGLSGSESGSGPGAEVPTLFSGDTLFAGSIGRMDLPGGDEAAMFDSLTRVILPLDDATVVHPGHGPSTTVGRERAANPYLIRAAGEPAPPARTGQ
ncbi:MAG TPA: MBL fold metallo-hydrolase [Mycobacteriales bacterium]|nr:MBL fold metallo-hydrolase [Mycobacteriales bacterium]